MKAVLTNYKEIDEVNRPTTFQGIWHYEDGDVMYFDGDNLKVSYQ